MLSVKQGGIKYSLWYDATGIEPRYPGPLANNIYIYIYIYKTSKSYKTNWEYFFWVIYFLIFLN